MQARVLQFKRKIRERPLLVVLACALWQSILTKCTHKSVAARRRDRLSRKAEVERKARQTL